MSDISASSSLRGSKNSPRHFGLPLLIVVALLAFHSVRLVNRIHWPETSGPNERGFVDFQNTVFNPVRYALSGQNPYSIRYKQTHSEGRSFPLFPPHSLLLHSPFALLPLSVSLAVYFVFELLLLATIVYWLQRQAFGAFDLQSGAWTAVAVLASPCVYSQLYLGQLTLQIVLGSWLALAFARDRPWLAAVGLTIAAIKPQFAAPIGFLILCRGHWKPIVICAAMAIVLNLIALVPIVANTGIEGFINDVKEQYFSLDGHPDIGEAAENHRRIDVYAAIARMGAPADATIWKLIVSGTMLLLGAITTIRLARHDSLSTGTTGQLSEVSRRREFAFQATAVIVTLGWIYHSNYDGILAFGPLSLFLGAKRLSDASQDGGRFIRLTALKNVDAYIWIVAILAVVAFNFLALERLLAIGGAMSADQLVWTIATSLVPALLGIGAILSPIVFSPRTLERPA